MYAAAVKLALLCGSGTRYAKNYLDTAVFGILVEFCQLDLGYWVLCSVFRTDTESRYFKVFETCFAYTRGTIASYAVLRADYGWEMWPIDDMATKY